MLTRLHEVLSIDILSNWCDLKTIAKANSAFCNKMERLDLLCLISDPTFGSHDITYRSSDAFWKWMVLNRIKVYHLKSLMWGDRKFVRFIANLDCSKVVDFHIDKLKNLNHVAMLMNKMNHLKVLTVNDFEHEPKTRRMTKTTLNKFFSLVSDHILYGLNKLTILGQYRESFQNPLDLSKVATICTQLRCLSVLKWNNGINEHTLIQIIQNNKQLQRLTLDGCDCKTALMRTIKQSCEVLESLVICDINTNDCSVESVCEMLTSCKQLILCRLSRGLVYHNDPTTLRIRFHRLLPVCSVIYELRKNMLRRIQLCGPIEEILLLQISLGCPLLTELCIFEPWHSWSVDTLDSIVTHCTLLRNLTLSYVDATHDEMMRIFCSDRVLVLRMLDVLTVAWSYSCIEDKNGSIVSCVPHW
jgi:hypothetical protein